MRIFIMPMRIRSWIVVVACTLILACTAPATQRAANQPLPADAPPSVASTIDFVGPNAIALAFSGGGLRASAFAHGALLALDDTATESGDLIDEISLISSVSGGSLTAAHFGLFGRAGLEHFRGEVLLHDFQHQLHQSLVNPLNLARFMRGGFNRSADLADVFDREVFHGARFDALLRNPKPSIRIHGTDLYHRISFPFIPRVFALLCSDLGSYRVADAVAASMAVPMIFTPMVLRSYPDSCREPMPIALLNAHSDPNAPRALRAAANAFVAYRDRTHDSYIRIVDGGLADNLGVATLAVSRAILGTPYAPMSARDAVTIRRLLFIVVDSSIGPSGDWLQKPEGPSGPRVAMITADAATDASARYAGDALQRMLEEWQEDVITFRCALSPDQVAGLGGPRDWHCDDVRFSVAFLSIDQLTEPYRSQLKLVPTRLDLDVRQLDATIEGSRRALQAHPRFIEYVRDRVTPASPPP
jgi:NTE family protein